MRIHYYFGCVRLLDVQCANIISCMWVPLATMHATFSASIYMLTFLSGDIWHFVLYCQQPDYIMHCTVCVQFRECFGTRVGESGCDECAVSRSLNHDPYQPHVSTQKCSLFFMAFFYFYFSCACVKWFITFGWIFHFSFSQGTFSRCQCFHPHTRLKFLTAIQPTHLYSFQR